MEGRKAMSAEPPTAAWVQGKRWEDLIEAATSATEVDDDRDVTPVSVEPIHMVNFLIIRALRRMSVPSPARKLMHQRATSRAVKILLADNPWHLPQMPQSPNHHSMTTAEAAKRSSLPPGFRLPGHLQQQYNASPLQNALTPPPPDDALEANEPFPSVESSLDSVISGQNFHMPASGLSTSGSVNNDTSPLQPQSHPYHHSQSSSLGSRSDSLEVFCASCGRPWLLKSCFACTECISACCSDCVGQIISSPVVTVQPGFAPVRRGCPRCGVMGGKWKRFQLDFR